MDLSHELCIYLCYMSAMVLLELWSVSCHVGVTEMSHYWSQLVEPHRQALKL